MFIKVFNDAKISHPHPSTRDGAGNFEITNWNPHLIFAHLDSTVQNTLI